MNTYIKYNIKAFLIYFFKKTNKKQQEIQAEELPEAPLAIFTLGITENSQISGSNGEKAPLQHGDSEKTVSAAAALEINLPGF